MEPAYSNYGSAAGHYLLGNQAFNSNPNEKLVGAACWCGDPEIVEGEGCPGIAALAL